MADFYVQKTAAGVDGDSFELAMPMPMLIGGATATRVAILETVELPVRTLSHIFHSIITLGRKQIALMKMDVEGSEYGVLEDWCASPSSAARSAG
jgi:hypothetical protein